MTELTPPYDAALEQSLLGCVLLSGKLLPTLVSVEGIGVETFWIGRHRTAFEAMLAIDKRGDGIDHVTLADEMRRGGAEEETVTAVVGGLLGASFLVGRWAEYARRLAEIARMRVQYVAAQELLHAAAALDAGAAADAEAKLVESDHGIGRRPTREARQEALVEAFEAGDAKILRSPFLKLNSLLAGGFRPSQFTTLGGWASHGKSVIATQLLTHFEGQGARCGLYTNEMEPLELDQREMARLANVPLLRLMEGKLHTEEEARFVKHLPSIGKGFSVIEAAGMTADEIAYDIRRERWDVAVIDLLNALPGSGETKGIDANMITLSSCARQSGSHIIACQHLNQARHVGREYPPEPVQADIRGSGQIYNLSNNVLFVYLEESSIESGEPSTEAVLKVGKARGGLRGRLHVSFQPNRARFLPKVEEGTVVAAAA